MLSDEEVRKIAGLARIAVGDEELLRLTKDVNSVLGYVQQLEKYDVAEAEPMSHVHGISNVFRDDAVKESLSREEGLQNAPETDGMFFRVPLIVEQKTES